MAEQNSNKITGVQSIDRAFDILECLSCGHKGFRLTDLSEQLGLHKSTVHRILNSMQERGYIEKADRYYKLGPGFIHLSSQFLNSIELKTEAEPLLRSLSDETGQTVFMAVREDTDVVYIDKVEQYNSLRRYSIIGTRAPVYCTSLGRALLFDSDEIYIRNLLERTELKKLTRNTVINSENLIKKITEFNERGWAEDIEEHQEGVRCAGAPIYDYRRRIIAAISTAWSIRKIGVDPDVIGRFVKETAEQISKRLGWI